MPQRIGWTTRGSKRSGSATSTPTGARSPTRRSSSGSARSSIPPAWKDVWISPSARTKLQATGIDAAGRKQYLYHPEFRARQEQAKYDKLIRFAEKLPRAARGDGAAHGARRAAAGEGRRDRVRLINLGWFRVGGDRYAKTSRTFGITTLRK